MEDIKWEEITNNPKVIELIKKREKIGDQIREIDENALIKYELQIICNPSK